MWYVPSARDKDSSNPSAYYFWLAFPGPSFYISYRLTVYIPEFTNLEETVTVE